MAFYGLPIDFIAAYTNGWKMGKGMCEATGFILSASGLMKHLSETFTQKIQS